MYARCSRAFAALVLAGCASTSGVASQSAPPLAAYAKPAGLASILVLTDRTSNPAFAPRHAEQVMNALRHFTPQTSWKYIDQLTPDDAAHAEAVVYLGDNGAAPVPAAALEAFRKVKRLVLTRYHVHQFHDAGIAFTHVSEGPDQRVTGALSATYGTASVGVRQYDALELRLAPPAELIANFHFEGRTIPYVVRDGTATFINGTIDYDRLEARPQDFGQAILVSDVLNDALGAHPSPDQHLAMLRLEDVSVQTQASRLKGIAEYLFSQGVPYGMGVIPDQLIKGQNLSTLSQDPELVGVLQYAQDHGATIILHGLHHSFNSAEDFEFWDPLHHRGLPQDSPHWMDSKITEGLKIEKALGLRPAMWETPHYSASATDYHEIAKFFPAAWEDRPPNGWLPWPLQRDEFGTALLPENIGYVANDGSRTVDDQLAVAKQLLICRGCIAAGFLHPATIPLSDFRNYVNGMRALGYQFTDPGKFIQ